MFRQSMVCKVGRVRSFHLILPVFLLFSSGIPAAAQETGIQIKKPVFGGACKACPWGAMAEIVKSAMQPYGYEVQICYTCSGMDAVRIVSGAKIGPAPKPESATQIPPPKGPVDFGATAVHFLWAAYQGTGMYAADGPMKNLRLLANIQDPLYLVVAVKAASGITDLRQIKEKKLPVQIIGNLDAGYSDAVLGYYGITAKELETWGGRMVRSSAEGRKNFDVVIHEASRGNPPEFSLFNEISETNELKYLDLPEDLLAQMARKFELERQNIPIGFLRGVDRTIPTVTRSGTVICGRADLPDDFAYAVARALDEQQDLFAWSNNTFSYNRFRVGKAFGVPLHPGAARYYQEKGYITK
jgi:TRAP transporter TAXI family solute receptor